MTLKEICTLYPVQCTVYCMFLGRWSTEAFLGHSSDQMGVDCKDFKENKSLYMDGVTRFFTVILFSKSIPICWPLITRKKQFLRVLFLTF